MFERLLEAWAAKGSERFRLYRKARLDYEAYQAEQGVPFDALTTEHYRRAAEDSRLQSAEEGYREAIRLSQAEGAFIDVASALYQLGVLLHLQGRFAEAVGPLQTCLN